MTEHCNSADLALIQDDNARVREPQKSLLVGLSILCLIAGVASCLQSRAVTPGEISAPKVWPVQKNHSTATLEVKPVASYDKQALGLGNMLAQSAVQSGLCNFSILDLA